MNVSVIIPTYNRGYIIKESIESVLNQTKKPFEILVVDDGSTDNTKEVIEQINSPIVKYLRNERVKGANGARNTGILRAQGDLIAFQDSDDLWRPNKLEVQVNYMLSNPEVNISYCSLSRDFSRVRKIPSRYIKVEEFLHEVRKVNIVSTQTIIMKTSTAKKYLFDESLTRLQDWEFILRISKKEKVYHVPEVLVDVRIQENSITNKESTLLAHQKLYERYPEISNYGFRNKYLMSLIQFEKEKKIKYFLKYIYFKSLNVLNKIFEALINR